MLGFDTVSDERQFNIISRHDLLRGNLNLLNHTPTPRHLLVGFTRNHESRNMVWEQVSFFLFPAERLVISSITEQQAQLTLLLLLLLADADELINNKKIRKTRLTTAETICPSSCAMNWL